MASIEELLNNIKDNQISLSELKFDEISPKNPEDMACIRGTIAEKLVENWLSNCEGISFDKNLPRKKGDYFLKKTDLGTTIYYQGKTIHEYDFLIYFNNKPYIIEVKSNRTHGLIEALKRGENIAKDIYGVNEIDILVFFPIYPFRRKYAHSIETELNNIHCIDIGYSKKKFQEFIEEYILNMENIEKN